jgi:TonB family protein
MAERELYLFRRATEQNPAHRRAAATSWAIAIGVHVVAVLTLIAVFGTRPLQVGVSALNDTIGAFVFPGATPTGTSGAEPARPKPEPAPKPSPDAGEDTAEDTGAAQDASGQIGSLIGDGGGPVRLVSGISVQLVKKVVPQYPVMMQSAGIPGVVVLDAIIHRDGSIGEITVLQSSHPAFTQAAIDAVKQWQYTQIPYEGIVTVTLTFKLNA